MVVENKKDSKGSSHKEHRHPLDPLSYQEINKTTEIVKNKANLGREILFETIVLREPDKKVDMNWSEGQEITREAFVVVLNYKEGKVYELVISLEIDQITSIDLIPDLSLIHI